ncbi:MAG: TonB family protein [Paludibacter sp.]
MVNKAGKVEKAEILRGVSPEIDAEALRVVNAMSQWIPGEQKGKKVSVYYTLPIQFKLDGGKNDKVIVKESALVICDGKMTTMGEMKKTVKASQIEKMDVLKDSAAVKLYGDKGKNGVVIVTLKK